MNQSQNIQNILTHKQKHTHSISNNSTILPVIADLTWSRFTRCYLHTLQENVFISPKYLELKISCIRFIWVLKESLNSFHQHFCVRILHIFQKNISISLTTYMCLSVSVIYLATLLLSWLIVIHHETHYPQPPCHSTTVFWCRIYLQIWCRYDADWVSAQRCELRMWVSKCYNVA